MIFVDTSAFLAVLITDDLHHQRAMHYWPQLVEGDQTLLTNNYVLLESIAIVQKRLGLSKVRDFHEKLLPFLTIEWIDGNQHDIAFRYVLAANRRQLSLVDCSSFESMRRLGIKRVFSFDTHFNEQDFEVIP